MINLSADNLHENSLREVLFELNCVRVCQMILIGYWSDFGEGILNTNSDTCLKNSIVELVW